MFSNDMTGTYGPLIFILAVAFVLVWPSVLLALIEAPGKEKRFLAISLGIGLVAMVFGTAGMAYAGHQPGLLISGIILLLIVTVSASAVMTASVLSGNLVPNNRRISVGIGSLIQLPFLFALLVNPVSWPGGPLPLFADRLPIFGMFFDALAEAIGTAGRPGYEVFFASGLLAGLYLEVFFGVAAVSLIAGVLIRHLGGDGMKNSG